MSQSKQPDFRIATTSCNGRSGISIVISRPMPSTQSFTQFLHSDTVELFWDKIWQQTRDKGAKYVEGEHHEVYSNVLQGQKAYIGVLSAGPTNDERNAYYTNIFNIYSNWGDVAAVMSDRYEQLQQQEQTLKGQRSLA